MSEESKELVSPEGEYLQRCIDIKINADEILKNNLIGWANINFIDTESIQKGMIIEKGTLTKELKDMFSKSSMEEIKNIFKKSSPKNVGALLSTKHVFHYDGYMKRAEKSLRNFIFRKEVKNQQVQLSEEMEEEKIKSGNIIDFFTCFRFDDDTKRRCTFIITTKGVAYIYIQDASSVTTNQIAMGAAGIQGLGAIGAVAAHAISGAMANKRASLKKIFSKDQKKLLKRCFNLPLNLVAKAYPEGIFIPYQNINFILSYNAQQTLSIHFGDKYNHNIFFDEVSFEKIKAIFQEKNIPKTLEAEKIIEELN